MPVGSPDASRSILAPGGSGVLEVIPAAVRAAVLTTGDMAVGAGEDGGMAGGDGVDVLTGGKGFGRPDGVVPASAL